MTATRTQRSWRRVAACAAISIWAGLGAAGAGAAEATLHLRADEPGPVTRHVKHNVPVHTAHCKPRAIGRTDHRREGNQAVEAAHDFDRTIPYIDPNIHPVAPLVSQFGTNKKTANRCPLAKRLAAV